MKRWLVMGAGISGLAAARLLHKRGEKVRLADERPVADAAALVGLGFEVRVGPFDERLLDDVIGVVLSPGIPLTHALVVTARARGLQIFSELDLSLPFLSSYKIGVTGTNGKSTVCKMTEHLIAKERSSVLAAGNIGVPPSTLLVEERVPDYIVVELSSYQLEHSERMSFDAVAFMNFSEDHLGRHGTLRDYFAAKWKLVGFCKPTGLIVLSQDVCRYAKDFGFSVPRNAVCLGPLEIIFQSAPGGTVRPFLEHCASPHNNFNATVAAHLAGAALEREPIEIAAGLVDFRPLPYRCETIGTWQGKPVINDSKSTNVDSTLVALRAQEEPCVLLLGGQPKGEAFLPIIAESARIRNVIAFGAAGERIERELGSTLSVRRFPTLAAALGALPETLAEPAPILFSPGCASFDEFKNFEDRGRFFNQLMAPLLSS